MTPSRIRRASALSISALLGLTLLASCGKTEAPPAAAAAASPASDASAPIAGVVPQAEDSAGSGVPGPGSGTTAVGGMAAQQERGGASGSAGTAPAPTGGDGAASASLPAPK